MQTFVEICQKPANVVEKLAFKPCFKKLPKSKAIIPLWIAELDPFQQGHCAVKIRPGHQLTGNLPKALGVDQGLLDNAHGKATRLTVLPLQLLSQASG